MVYRELIEHSLGGSHLLLAKGLVQPAPALEQCPPRTSPSCFSRGGEIRVRGNSDKNIISLRLKATANRIL